MIDIQYGSKPLHTPAGKIYFIGDIHNEAVKLMDILGQIAPLITPEDHIVFLGDLFDRGPHAALTLETLVNFAQTYPNQTFFVRGNHDHMLQHYLMTGSHEWFTYLRSTLDNFKEKWDLPDIEVRTIAEALLNRNFTAITSRFIPYYETNELVATHAPFDFMTCMMFGLDHYEVDYNERIDNVNFKHFLERLGSEIMWTFTDEKRDIPAFKKFRVCGHQPGPGRAKHPRLFKDRAFIDTGCGKGNRPLTCMVYPGKKCYQSE
jgi:hypothetical protein